MSLRRFARALPLVITLLFSCALSAQQKLEWNVDLDLTTADQASIEKLLKKMKLDAARVTVSYVIPTGGQKLIAHSNVTVEGNHRTWSEVSICRKDWWPLYCASKSKQSEGRWYASSQDTKERETWTVRDGEWQLVVPVEPGAPFRDVEQIILAIRRGQLINRLTKSETEMPEIDPTKITWIRKITSGYEVRTGKGSGEILGVRIVGTAVELFSYKELLV
jgi:hypothetical protein